MGDHDDPDSPASRWFGGSCERCGHSRQTHHGFRCTVAGCECWGYADGSDDEGNDAA